MAAKFLDDAARAAFKRAIETIEGASAVEVVIALRRRSDGYFSTNVTIGACIAFVALAAMLYSPEPFSQTAILFDPFIVGILGGALIELVPQLKRWLTPRFARHEEVVESARATFVERGVHNTIASSGMLVYISWLEREIVIVPDSGITRTAPAELLVNAEREMNRVMREGGAAVAKVLEGLAQPLSVAMPRSANDVNELSDAIDEGSK